MGFVVPPAPWPNNYSCFNVPAPTEHIMQVENKPLFICGGCQKEVKKVHPYFHKNEYRQKYVCAECVDELTINSKLINRILNYLKKHIIFK